MSHPQIPAAPLPVDPIIVARIEAITQLAQGLSDRVAVMHSGSLVEEGPVRQVLCAPVHDYTQRLLATVPGMRVGSDGGRC